MISDQERDHDASQTRGTEKVCLSVTLQFQIHTTLCVRSLCSRQRLVQMNT